MVSETLGLSSLENLMHKYDELMKPRKDLKEIKVDETCLLVYDASEISKVERMYPTWSRF